MGKVKKTRSVTGPGKKPVVFHPGGLHQSVGVPVGKPIPKATLIAAVNGDYGPKAQKQAQFARNVLTGPARRGSSRGR